MKNNNPKTHFLKKLRGKGYISVDKQLLRWKNRGGRHNILTDKKLQRANARRLKTLLDAPGCPINDDPLSLRGPTPEKPPKMIKDPFDVGFFDDAEESQ